MGTFHVENFGCRAARADGEAIAERLVARGRLSAGADGADVVVVNTCSVTAEADRTARAFIRRAHRANPGARIVVTGCYAQRAPEELAKLPGVAAVVGNSHRALAPDVILHLISRGDDNGCASGSASGLVPVHSLIAGQAPIWADDRFAHSFLEEAQLAPGQQTRPNLKIQEGCGNRCTFCVIPFTRGPSRSLPAESVLKQVRGFASAGGNELVLSGINLGRWGRDLADSGHVRGSRLAALIRRIFDETDLPRLRLSSIEPMDWDEETIALMAEFGGSRLCRHAHLPLQSGSDAVLRRMHRRYRPWHYAEKAAALFGAAGRELTLGADVMVGFPGETDTEFEETLKFVRALPFGYLHLFPFSPRPGTRGWALHQGSPVPARVAEERMTALRALGCEKMRAHRGQFAGREIEAITLHTPKELAAQSRTPALSENFLPVEIAGEFSANSLARLRITGMTAGMVLEATISAAETPAIEVGGALTA